MNGADFALPSMNAPAVGARPSSADELAGLGLDQHRRLAESTKYQGEAGSCELEKTLDEGGLLMEVNFVAAAFLKFNTTSSRCSDQAEPA